MKKLSLLIAAAAAFGIASVNASAADVGVSISVGQPGFYGRLDIGDYYPRPELVYAEPRVVYVEPAYRYARPIYLHVPPGHARDWDKHCRQYNACGRPVYFVQDTWYQHVYSPRYTSYHEHGDDGRRYDHDYWDKRDHGGHNGPPDHPGHGEHGGGHGNGHRGH